MRRGTFPPINVGATPDRDDVYVFAAGLDPKSIELSIQQNLLAISGRRAVEAKADVQATRYRRSFTVGSELDTDPIEASMKDGVLTLHVPKRAEFRPRRIEVQSA